MQKICEDCGTAFEASHGNQKYCSKRCLNRVREIRRSVPCAQCGRPRIGGGRDVGSSPLCRWCRGYGSKPKARPTPPRLLQCKGCGAMFETTRTDKIYCRAECRQSVSNWGKKKASFATATERGYGAEHKRERAKWKPMVDRGEIDCCLCGDPIEPGSAWHLDHTPDRTSYRGAAHASCNVKDGAVRGALRAPRPILSKTCGTCGTSFPTRYPKQNYCSPKCRPSRQVKPKARRAPRSCVGCGEPILRGKRCATCARQHTRDAMRNAYRRRVGIPLDVPKHDRSWRAA
jgi:hypothetical protein